MKYRNTQIGWLIISIFMGTILFTCLMYMEQLGEPISSTPLASIVVFFIILLSLFYKLTVEVEGSIVKIIYGIGLITIRLKMDDLNNVVETRTPWYAGLGIRLTAKGMLYNIQSLSAVELHYTRKGKKNTVMIGTPEPALLKAAITDHWKNKR